MSEAELSDFEDDELDAAPVVLNNPKPDPSESRISALSKELDEVRSRLEQSVKQRDEALKQLDLASKQKDDANKARDQARSEIEAAAKLLIAGAEKLTPLLGESKAFTGGFPRSSKYTGIAAICHGFCKRTEEIVEEVVRQRDLAIGSRNEVQNRMDQRNYEIAIEVSHLEDSLERKMKELEKVAEAEQQLHAKLARVSSESEVKVAKLVSELEAVKKEAESRKVECVEVKRKLVEQMKGFLASEEMVASLVHKVEGKAVVSVAGLPFSDFTDAGKVHEEYLKRVNSLSGFLEHMKNRWEEKEEVRVKEKTALEKEVQRLLQREKEAAAFVRNSLKETHSSDEEQDFQTLLGLMDGELRRMRVKCLDLEKQLADTRVEAEKVTKLSVLQAKDLIAKAGRIQELEERHGVASENVEGLTAEIAAAEEELVRWKKAATEEAAAGVAILEEVERCNQEIAALNQLVVHLRQSLEESDSKLQSKEEMAAAAIAARNAADRSLKIADERAAELRERLEDMSRQMEDVEAQLERSRVCGGKFLELVPWFKARFDHYKASLRQTTAVSAEMEELSEPLVTR